jgi:hypothetical protein
MSDYDYYDAPSWAGLVEDWGYEVLSDEFTVGDYLVLLRDDDRLGFAMIGYGSCSGCDALAACRSAAEVAGLSEDVRDGVRWFATPADLVAFLDGEVIKGEYYYWDAHTRRVLVEFREVVSHLVRTERA